MNTNQLLWGCLMVLISLSIQAQNYGGEIVSNQKFGEGLMVVRAKIVPISGTVSNIFFFNRDDEPWNGNVWYEYDWEIRGKYPSNGWSQIRVRSEDGAKLKDEPKNISTSVNLGNKLYNYILIRKDETYVYDIREDFDIDSYNYEKASSHGENSKSLVVGGPRVFKTGNGVDHIPQFKQLDFSLGITAFDSGWAGSLPSGSYSGDFYVDYARFYTYNNNNINTQPNWQDEFNNNQLDYGKWQVANWTYAKTQFRQENIRFENGNVIFRINNESNNNDNSQLVTDGTYVIEGSNGQYLSSPTSNNNVSMKNADSSKEENQWIIEHLGDNTYAIKNVDTNRFLEVPYGDCGKGSNVATTKYADKDWKKWIISKNGNDFMLKPAHCTSTALDKNSGNSKNVHLWNYSTNNGNQKWQIVSLSNANSRLLAPVENLPEIPIMFNAAQHQLTINLSNYTNEAINYFISALNGQVMLHGKISENHSNIENLNIRNLATGSYIIYLKPAHKQEIVQKFVITRR